MRELADFEYSAVRLSTHKSATFAKRRGRVLA